MCHYSYHHVAGCDAFSFVVFKALCINLETSDAFITLFTQLFHLGSNSLHVHKLIVAWHTIHNGCYVLTTENLPIQTSSEDRKVHERHEIMLFNIMISLNYVCSGKGRCHAQLK